ncbi:MAG TPA: ASPIC/UnbV domain-containing protein, partial [Kofleriaceae bacterium]|nr:ASPIC/UnbV domain-containing protein [Kofleriaceae bacterium]
LDLYISNVGRNRLFTGSAGGAFTDATEIMDVGAARRSTPACASSTDLACLLVSWGAVHADLDLDGVDELLFVNGHIEGAAPQPAIRLVPSGTAFERAASGLACTAARALIAADLDGDGDLDAVVTGSDAPMRVYENTTSPAGGWLRVRAAGTRSNRDGIGAVVTLTLAGGRRITRAIGAGGVVHSSGPAEAHFGLGSAGIEMLEVRWPSGAVQTVTSVSANQLLVVAEP